MSRSTATRVSDVVVQTYSDNLVEFVLPHGQGSNNTIEIEVAGKVFSNKVSFAYDPPLIQALSTNVGITDGNTLIMLHGQNFGETKYVMIRLSRAKFYHQHTTKYLPYKSWGRELNYR